MPQVRVKIKKDKKLYKERTDMPFWFLRDKEKYLQILDDDSFLSVDSNYDPEQHINIKYYEEISRILDYKFMFTRYV